MHLAFGALGCNWAFAFLVSVLAGCWTRVVHFLKSAAAALSWLGKMTFSHLGLQTEFTCTAPKPHTLAYAPSGQIRSWVSFLVMWSSLCVYLIFRSRPQRWFVLDTPRKRMGAIIAQQPCIICLETTYTPTLWRIKPDTQWIRFETLSMTAAIDVFTGWCLMFLKEDPNGLDRRWSGLRLLILRNGPRSIVSRRDCRRKLWTSRHERPTCACCHPCVFYQVGSRFLVVVRSLARQHTPRRKWECQRDHHQRYGRMSVNHSMWLPSTLVDGGLLIRCLRRIFAGRVTWLSLLSLSTLLEHLLQLTQAGSTMPERSVRAVKALHLKEDQFDPD